MWEEFLNASLRDNLMLIASIIGSLGGLSFFLSIGWLRRARNSSQTILALEDENKTFRHDFAVAQVRLDKVDPDIVGPKLQGQTRLPALADRASLARTYQDLHEGTTAASALTLARQSVFEYSADPDRAIATARHQLALASLLDPENPEIARLTDAVDRLAALPDRAQVVWQPEVFALPDYELQRRAREVMRAGRLHEALFLSQLCAEKAEQRTGPESDNFASALTTLAVNQSILGFEEAANATHARCLAIFHRLLDPDHPRLLFIAVHPALFLANAGKLDAAAACLETLETRIETALGHSNDAAMVHCLSQRAAMYEKLGDLDRARGDQTRAAAIYDYLKLGNHPSLSRLTYDPHDFAVPD
ncbi:hypothetical protein LCL97_02345 [Seohaeicola saemankumensis]|nr:hypothetical protein [Seohaeicola saemankumensis]MCA0869656.1 hypothetical protein [Seohaeicola saemankumensis]